MGGVPHEHRKRMWGTAAVLVALASCVPHVELEGAPCPCPEGYKCCEIRSDCVATEKPCPTSYPPSSGESCSDDADCPAGELCHAWTDNESSLAGPQTCQRDCSAGLPCAQPEVCQLSLRDGSPVDNLYASFMCSAVPDGCEDAGCQECDPSQLGRTYCESREIKVCFAAVHPVCGLICSTATAQVCGDAGCMDSGGIGCNSTPSGDPCAEFPCATCPNPSEPGGFVCDGGNRAVGCTQATLVGGSCDTICQEIALHGAASSACVGGERALWAP
jgi:hypothetical protein